MREIKFRVWDGYKIHYPTVVEIGICGVNSLTSASFQSEKGGYTTSAYVMQFTGLHDKNGVEIYEGDVCVFDIFDTLTRYPDLNPFESYLVVIEWKHGAWGFRFLYPELVNEDDREWCAFWNSKDGEMWNLKYFRVIGNIHAPRTAGVTRCVNSPCSY
jgi:uncharacterized phage protein (TIGR01671 family)